MAALDAADQTRIDNLIIAHDSAKAAMLTIIADAGAGVDQSAATVDVLVLTDSLSTFTNNVTFSGNIQGTTVFAGFINAGNKAELTISGGVITPTKSFHSVDTEANVASDEVDTITAATLGDRLVLIAAANGRTIVFKDGTGNLRMDGDFSLTQTQDTIEFFCDGSNWLELSRSDNTV